MEQPIAIDSQPDFPQDASAELVAMYKDILQKCIGRTEPDMVI